MNNEFLQIQRQIKRVRSEMRRLFKAVDDINKLLVESHGFEYGKTYSFERIGEPNKKFIGELEPHNIVNLVNKLPMFKGNKPPWLLFTSVIGPDPKWRLVK